MNPSPAAVPSAPGPDTAPVPAAATSLDEAANAAGGGPDVAAGAASSLRLNCGYGTDRGLRREMNEDSFIASDPVFAVADGMGGHEAGEIASGICVRTLARIPQLASGKRDATAGVVQEHLLMADESIREATGSRAGTTLSGVVVVEQTGVPYWLVLNIGDSRTYRLSQGKLTQVSVDHSEVQELVDAGQISQAEAAVHPRRHVVTRALGTGDEIEADYWLLPMDEGDRILVCSDGLNGELDDQHIANILRAHADPQAAVDELIQAALRSGGRDNVTCIVLDATNVTHHDAAAQTAPRSAAAAEDEDTLPRTDALDLAPNGELLPGAETADGAPAGAVGPEVPAAEEHAAAAADAAAEAEKAKDPHDGKQ
ncbi:PP2C family protein-serine/threonine phosphatase [Arthrobacter sp. EPSL27]|uniref:PP2C family protein-serine/threonine phosphatase n=1 Tax=Arthrobacter sp. EPSL27 TaxID=1745378 RepID=UPI0009E92B41|nr:protein phosphatase 2C domain-containing protein [Arthrobacter sp. EPSL27]